MRGWGKIGIFILVVCHGAPGGTQVPEQAEAARRFSARLLKLSRSVDLRESRYPESSGAPTDFDANSGNSRVSNTTYHSQVWDFCEQWISPQHCGKWRPAYVTGHYNDPDQSQLEAIVGKFFQAKRDMIAPKQNGVVQYGIWDIKAKGGGGLPFKDDKRLDRGKIVEMRVSDDVRMGINKTADDVANRNLAFVTGEEKSDINSRQASKILLNTESQRLLASRWTRMLRNRLVSNLGEERVYAKPIEYALDEEHPDCEAYYTQVMREVQAAPKYEQRILPQGKLDRETRLRNLQQRLALCKRMRQVPVYVVNPKFQGSKLVAGNPNDADVTKWRLEVNIKAIDFGGIDPNTDPSKPSDINLRRDEYAQELDQYDTSGNKISTIRLTNAEQLALYNQDLAQAAQDIKRAAAISNVEDYSAQVLSYQIKNGQQNLIRLNSFTNTMREELGKGGFPRANGGRGRDPETMLEMRAPELTRSRR